LGCGCQTGPLSRCDEPARAFAHRTRQEVAMRKLIAVPLLAVASLAGAQQVPLLSAAQLDTRTGGSQCEVLMPPRVDRIGVGGAWLYAGMWAAEMGGSMGAAAEDDVGGNVRVLSYPREPIPTKVTISDGKVAGVTLDVAAIDERELPAYSRS